MEPTWPAPAEGTPAARLEGSSEARHQLRRNLARFGDTHVEEAPESAELAWTIDEESGKQERITWARDALTGHVFLHCSGRGDRKPLEIDQSGPLQEACPEGCKLAESTADTDPVAILTMPGSKLRDGAGEERELRHASARLNLFPYLPECALIIPVGNVHGRPATWPREAVAESLLIAGTLEHLAQRNSNARAVHVFQNLGHEAFSSQDHPHLQVVPLPRSFPTSSCPIPEAANEDPVIVRQGQVAARLRPAIGDPWIDLGVRAGLRSLTFEECLFAAELWIRIDRAYAQAGCDHLNVLCRTPAFDEPKGRCALVFVARERGWARGRAGFELLENDGTWVTGRDPRALAAHFEQALRGLTP